MNALAGGSDDPAAPSEPWQRALLDVARQTLELYITTAMMPVIPPVAGQLAEPAAVFVTLRVRDPKPAAEEELRGCVGQIEARLPLVEAVQDATIQAATADPRFPPVHESELPALRIEISILSPMWRVSDLAQIEIGRHGLLIIGLGHRGLLLPSVATQYGWDQRSFLRGLSMKAGLPSDAWPERAELYAFTTQHLSE